MQVTVLHVRVVSVPPGSAEMSHLPLFVQFHVLVPNTTAGANNIKQVQFLLLFIMPVLLMRNRSKGKKARRENAKESMIQGSYDLRETSP